MARDHYLVLGLSRGASPEQIKTAYRRCAKRLHPDACPEGCSEGFREISDAYETLSDETRRSAYDATLRCEPLPFAARPAAVCRGRAPATDPCPVVPLDEAPAFRRAPFTLDIEVRLPPELARAGGRISLALPVEARCPRCAGALPEAFWCPICGGRGAVAATVEVPLEIAPGTAHGERRTVALHRPELMLRVRFVRA